MKSRLTAISFGVALMAAIYLLVWPVYAGFVHGQHVRGTMLQVDGPHALIAVLFPVLTTLTALLLRKQAARIIATILLAGFVVISGFTIGLFYLPAAILLLLACCVADSSKFRDAF